MFTTLFTGQTPPVRHYPWWQVLELLHASRSGPQQANECQASTAESVLAATLNIFEITA